MSTLIAQRWRWAPLMVVGFAWLVAGLVMSEERPQAGVTPAIAVADGQRPDAPARAARSSETVTAAPLASYASSRAARERLNGWNRLQEAARSQEPPATRPAAEPATRPAASEPASPARSVTTQPTSTQPAATQPTDPAEQARQAREARREAARERIEEARRRAAEAQAARAAGADGADTPEAGDPEKAGAENQERDLEALREAARASVAAREAERLKRANGDEAQSEEGGRAGRITPRESGANGSGAAAGGGEPAVDGLPNEQVEAAAPEKAADGRDYFISFKATPWEDVIRHYAKLVGKPILDNGQFVAGELTYESTRKFTLPEMRDELNFLLLEQGYFIVEKEDYIYLVPSSELSKEMPLLYFFDSVASFRLADLRPLELCSVLIQVKDRPAQEIVEMLSPSMPDRALPVVVGDTNRIRIVGLAQDVERFLGLMQVVETQKYDPAETRFIEIETNVTEIERMIREYFELNRGRTITRRGRRVQVEEADGEEVLLIGDERTKTLIVKATPAMLDEIQEFVNQIDVKPKFEFATTVIEVQHGNASDIASLLNKILQQEQGEQVRQPTRRLTAAQRRAQARRNARNRNNRNRAQQQAQTAAPESIVVEDLFERAKKTVRIVADDRTNSLIVYAAEEGLKRVREILAEIDRPFPSNYQQIELEYAMPSKILPLVQQLADAVSGGATGPRSASSGPEIVADDDSGVLHVVADREDFKRIEGIVLSLDVESAEDEWHVVELVNITPSEAAQKIRPILEEDSSSSRRRSPIRRGRGSRRTVASPTSQVIPMDEAQTLVVICSAEQWEDVERIIQLADENAISNQPKTRFFEIANGSPEAIANTLDTLFRNYAHPILGRSQVLIEADGQRLIANAVEPALEEIEALLPELDVKPRENPLVVIPLQYADATQLEEIARGLLPDTAQPQRGRRRGPGASGTTASITAEPITNSLIVQADQLTVARVKEFAAEWDQRVREQEPERRYYSLKNASPNDVVQAITSLFDATSGNARRGRGRGPVGTRIKTVIVGSQVVVDAPSFKQAEIGALVDKLDQLADEGVKTKLVKMPGADVRSVAQKLQNAFRDRVRKQGITARFEADTFTETILMTISADIVDEADGLLSEYKEITSELVWETEFFQLKHATANDTARWLNEQLVAIMTKQISTQAARQIKVTADQRTNRVIINAPSVAVKQGKSLLEQFDKPAAEAPTSPVDNWTVELPGLDVNSLARNLEQTLRNQPPRPDRLRAVVKADQLTNMLIISAPSDMKTKIDELIDQFAKRVPDLEPVQKFVQVNEADANYIAQQIRSILDTRVSRTRGRAVAQQINIGVDTRQNTLIVNAPKFTIEMIDELVAQLDQPSVADRQLQTIPLTNADANTVLGVLRTIFNEKIRARTLSISSEPLTNALIVGGNKEDFEEIEQWAKELDAKAVEKISDPVIIEFKNANPWEVFNVLNQTFMQRGFGRRVQPGREVKMSIIAGRSIVVQAPPDKLKQIQDLAKMLDEVGQNRAIVRKYRYPGLGRQLTQFSRQIENAFNRQVGGREQRISITPLPAADTLIVTATEQQLPQVESLMEQFKDLYEPSKIETVKLDYADANAVYEALRRVLEPKIRADRVQISVEGITNSLVVSAAEEDMTEIRGWVEKFDSEAEAAISPPRIFELKNANAWEVRNILNVTFVPRGSSRRQGGQEVRFDVLGGKSIVAKASKDKMDEIAELITELDQVVSNKAAVRTYKVPGLGNRLQQFARDIARAVNDQIENRDRRINITANPAADVLIVTATSDQFDLIEDVMTQFQAFYEPTRIETIELVNGDANTVFQSLQTVLRDEMRSGKLQVSVEGLTNSLIVMGTDEGIAKIKKWATEFDERAKDTISPPRIFELVNANPWEVRNVLNSTFASRGRRSAGGIEIRFDVMGGRNIVAKAPDKIMQDIADLIEKLDTAGVNKPEVRTYTLEGVGNRLDELGRQLERSVNAQVQGREDRVSITAYGPASALIVTALPNQFEQVEQMMTQFQDLMEVSKSVTKFYELEFVDADEIAFMIEGLVEVRLRERGLERRGRGGANFEVGSDSRTNRLIVFAPESMIPEIDLAVAEFDIPVEDSAVETIPVKFADPGQVRGMINDIFGQKGRGASRNPLDAVFVTVSNDNLVVKAPPRKMDEILELVKSVDRENPNDLTVKLYPLDVLDAFEVATQVQMFFASMGGRRRAGQMQPTAFGEPTTNTLVVIAPPDKLPFIDTLIAQVEGMQADRIIQIIPVENGDATEIAQTVRDTFTNSGGGGGMSRMFFGGRRGGRRGGGSATGEANNVQVTADASSNSILLNGAQEDIAEVVDLIKDLDAASSSIPELQYFTIKNASIYEVQDMLSALFGATITGGSADFGFEGNFVSSRGGRGGRGGGGASALDRVTVTVNEYTNRLLVTANKRKMREIEAVIEKLEADALAQLEDPTSDGLLQGKDLVFIDVNRGDAFDIAWEVREFFPPEEAGGPVIEADWFGEYIKVIARPAEVPKITELIRTFESKAKPEVVIRTYRFAGDTERLFRYLQEREIDYKLERPTAPVQDRRSLIIELHPEEDDEDESARATPAAGGRSGGGGNVVLTGLTQQAGRAAALQDPEDREESPIEATQPRVQILPDGRLLLRGDRDDVEELQTAIELFEEDLSSGEVIRIFKFRYGDVNTASRILDMMFNDQTPQRPQPRQRQPQQRGNQRGRGDDDDEEDPRQQSMMQQMQEMLGQRGRGSSSGPIRIATDAGRSFLFVKCEEKLLPEIIELLRELDRKPADVDLEVFQLENIDADEAAENIRSVLGMDGARNPRQALQNARGRGARGRQQQIMQLLQQQVSIGGAGDISAKIELVEIVSNSVTNSLLVSAPPEVMKIIRDIINKLEGLEARDAMAIRHYELKQARVEDVLPLLQEIFDAASTGGGGGARAARGRRGGGGSSPADLGPVSISGDPRSNQLVVVAQSKDIATVEAQIELLDIAGAVASVEMYVCEFGDAESIATVVEATMADGGGGARRGGRRGQPTGGGVGAELRITAEPGTNTILVYGSPEKRADALDYIKELDGQSRLDIREIPIEFAKAEDVAEKLNQVFGGSNVGATGGRRGGSRRAVSRTAGRIVILGDNDAKKILVRAPDPIFAKMLDLAETIDLPSQLLQLRTFTLTHVNASNVVETVKSAMTEYLQVSQLAGSGGDSNFDAFTVIPDARTNSIMVVGSEETFAFVGTFLANIDAPAPEGQERTFQTYVLDRADAQVVADAINTFASGEGGGADGQRGGRGGRRGLGGAGAGLSDTKLQVQAIADPSSNAVMVIGKSDDILAVEELVIRGFEDSVQSHKRIVQIPVNNASATQVASYIQQFLDTDVSEVSGRDGRSGQGAPRRAATIVPNDNKKIIVVQGSAGQVEEIRSLVETFDNPDLIDEAINLVRVPAGEDVFELAQQVQQLVNEGEQILADKTNRPPRLVSIVPNDYARVLMVYGDPSQYGVVETVVNQLRDIRPERPVTRIISLTNLTAEEASQIIDDLQDGATGGGNSRGIRRSPNRGGSNFRRSTPSRGGRNTGSRRRGSLDSMRIGQPIVGALQVAQLGSTLLIWQAASQATTTVQPPALAAAQVPPNQDQDNVDLQRPRNANDPLSALTGQLRGDVTATPLDSRRIIVTGDAADVEFIVQALALMEQSAPRPVIEVFTLEQAKAAAIAPVIEQTLNELIRGKGGGSDRADAFSIIAEGRGNVIIATASETNMDIIDELVTKLDTDTRSETNVRLFALQHMRAAEALELVRGALDQLAVQRGTPQDARPTVEVVERSNALMVVGTTADLREAEVIIEGVDVELPPEDDFSTALVTVADLQNAKAEDLAETLNALIALEREGGGQGGGANPLLRKLFVRTADGEELPPLDLDKPIAILPEEAKNAVMIFSNQKNTEALLEMVRLFDQLPEGQDVEVKVIKLAHGEAESVAELLQTVFDEGKTALRRPSEGDAQGLEDGVLPPLPTSVAGRGLPYNVVVSHDSRTNAVIVIGRSDATVLAAGLVKQLDRPGSEFRMQPFVLRLEQLQAATVKETLDEMLEERAEAIGGDQNTARDSAIIMTEERANALVVFATPEMEAMIRGLVTELDQASPYSVVDSQIRRITNADAAKLAGLLQELFDRKREADDDVTESGQTNVLHVFADARSNSIVLTGTRDYLQEANEIVDRLDQSYDPTMEFDVVSVTLNSAANIAQLLDDLIQKRSEDQESDLRGTPVHIAADPYSNSIVLGASSEDMQLLKSYIQILDRPKEFGRIIRILPLRRGEAEEVAQMAEELYQAQSEGADEDLTVTSHDPTNAVIAIGPPAIVKDVERFVGELNNAAVEGAALVRIFPLAEADAQVTAELLGNLLSGESTAGSVQQEALQRMLVVSGERDTFRAFRNDITVLENVRTNSLVVTAPPESMPLMESLIRSIDVPPTAAEIRVFKLLNSDAEEVATMLEELFEAEELAGSGTDDEREFALSLGGLGGGGRQILRFAVDTRINAVIAAGTKGYLELVDELVLQLDSEPLEDLRTIVYPVQYVEPEQLAQQLSEFSDAERDRLNELSDEISTQRQLDAELIVISSEDSDRIIVGFPPRRESQVLDLLNQLDQQPPQVMIQVLIIEVTMDNSLELGVEFAFQDLQYTKAGPTDTTTFDYVGGTDLGAAGGGLGGFTFTITGADFNFLIRTLQNEGRLNVLSRPQIVAMSNQDARIEITQDVPYVNSTSTSDAGQITTSVSRQDVGIILEVTPFVNPDGFVRMQIRQEVSDLTGSTIDVGQGVTAPIFTRREAETVVSVKDRETVVLGGLIETSEEDREQKIPGLGDVPGLGWLFRNDSRTLNRTELLVILTPRVIRTVEDFRELSKQERDRTGVLPDSVLTNPLLQGLQVKPEDLRPEDADDKLGPFPNGERSVPEDYDPDIYGPLRPASEPGRREAPRRSYDIPVSLLLEPRGSARAVNN